MVRYRFLLFDADNTLLDFFRSEESALTDALEKIGVQVTPEKVATYSRINDNMWKKLERGEITKTALRTERFAEFCKYYNIHTDIDALALSYTDFLSTKSFLMEGALETCRALAPHCTLYVITNGIKSVQTGRFAPSPLAPLFRASFISEEIGFEKPNPAYFREVARRIPDFDPRQALIVGDSLSSDIAGGIAAGIDTCWFNTKGEDSENSPSTYTVTRLEDVIPLVLRC